MVTIHPLTPSIFTIPHETIDIRTKVGELIYQQIYLAPGSLPFGGVNRIKDKGSNSIDSRSAAWESKTNEELDKDAKVDLDAKIVNVDSMENKVTLEFNVVSLVGSVTPPNLSIFVLEDDVTTIQSTDTGKIKKYKHKHLLREMLTPHNGKQIHTTFEKGLGIKRRIMYDIDPKVVLQNTSLLLMVHNVLDNQEILQSVEVPLYE